MKLTRFAHAWKPEASSFVDKMLAPVLPVNWPGTNFELAHADIWNEKDGEIVLGWLDQSNNFIKFVSVTRTSFCVLYISLIASESIGLSCNFRIAFSRFVMIDVTSKSLGAALWAKILSDVCWTDGAVDGAGTGSIGAAKLGLGRSGSCENIDVE